MNSKQLFRKPCEFVAGTTTPERLPKPHLPEVAFIGRSNVGKSSLINALVNHKGLAKTSNTPGRTQQINFFNLGEAVQLVDLPGYGFAKAPVEAQEAWHAMTHYYLTTRRTLKRLFVLIDARHGLKANDEEFIGAMDAVPVHYQLVLTKTDKSKAKGLQELQKTLEANAAQHPAMFPRVLLTSAKKRDGLDTLQQTIVELL